MAQKKAKADEQKKKAPEPIIEHIDVKHDFSIEEIGELARKAALSNQRVIELEQRKKQLNSDLNAQIESAQSDVNLLSIKVSNGFEMRRTECVVTLDPKNSSKDYHVKKTGEFARREEMTQSDFQLSMRFEREAEAQAKKDAAEAGKANVGEALSAAREAVGRELTEKEKENVIHNETVNPSKSPAEWAQSDGLVIVDPKGWLGRHKKDITTPISRAEYESRLALSVTEPNPQLRKPVEWAELDGVRILDPDGWRGAHAKDFEEPINRKEWENRKMRSTCDYTNAHTFPETQQPPEEAVPA